MERMDNQIYQVRLEYKTDRTIPDSYYQPLSVDKLFWANWLTSSITTGNDFQTAQEGEYKLVKMEKPTAGRMAIYMDAMDRDSRSDKLRLSNGKTVTLKLREPKGMDKICLQWEQCSCGTSAVYRVYLDYLTDTNQEPAYLKSGSMGVV